MWGSTPVLQLAPTPPCCHKKRAGPGRPAQTWRSAPQERASGPLRGERAYVVQQLGQRAIFRSTVETAHAAVAVEQDEARAVHQAAIHVAQFEAVAANVFEGRLIAGEEEPAARFGPVAGGVGRQCDGRIVLG